MATPDGRHRIIFNGEIYNYRELRRSLEARGRALHDRQRYRSAAAPAGLRRRGRSGAAPRDVRARVVGREARSLVLARDRFGIKPLYVAAGGGALAFASEIHALVASGLVERTIDPAGVLGYLAWGTVPPTLTCVAGVESLLPGAWLQYGPDGRRVQRSFADVAAVHARSLSGRD
jgi:asparagine synthase (glutamine-hydrolysing)